MGGESKNAQALWQGTFYRWPSREFLFQRFVVALTQVEVIRCSGR
jgi:hypothetical protein